MSRPFGLVDFMVYPFHIGKMFNLASLILARTFWYVNILASLISRDSAQNLEAASVSRAFDDQIRDLLVLDF